MTILSETMTKAISDYRLLLRRYLNQAERMMKLQQLDLKNADIYASDLMLYETGKAIIKDIDDNMATKNQGYYSYSGIVQFRDYLEEYLENYHVENDRVVHRAQKASRALIDAIQLTGIPREMLDESIAKQLFDCNKSVVMFGSNEQCHLQMQILVRQQSKNPGFATRIIAHLEMLLHSRQSEAA